jgi:hypothetical protein
MSSRKHISLTVKLAAALLKLGHVPHSQARRMTADQIIALYHFDHYPIPHAQGGVNEPWNLDPVLVAVHREKTAKIDLPMIAKTKRISKSHEEFRRKLLTPRDERIKPKSRWGSRPFPNRNRKNP